MTPEAIKAFRREKGWTQQQLATAIGVAVSSVARWEAQDGSAPKGASLMALQNLMTEGAPATEGMIGEALATESLPPEIEEQIKEIMGLMECPKAFKCALSGFEILCKARDIGLERFLECLEPNPEECKFAVPLEGTYCCQCPLRVFLSKRLGR